MSRTRERYLKKKDEIQLILNILTHRLGGALEENDTRTYNQTFKCKNSEQMEDKRIHLPDLLIESVLRKSELSVYSLMK